MQHTTAVFPVYLGIDYILPHTLISAGSVSHLPLGSALALSSWALCPRSISFACMVPSYVFVLLAPVALPYFELMGLIAGCGWVGYRFGLKGISFPDGLEVFDVCEFRC